MSFLCLARATALGRVVQQVRSHCDGIKKSMPFLFITMTFSQSAAYVQAASGIKFGSWLLSPIPPSTIPPSPLRGGTGRGGTREGFQVVPKGSANSRSVRLHPDDEAGSIDVCRSHGRSFGTTPTKASPANRAFHQAQRSRRSCQRVRPNRCRLCRERPWK